METTDLSDDDEVCADTRHALEHWYDASTVPAGAAEALLAQRPAIASPLDADLGDAVRLLGLDVTPARPKIGRQAHADLDVRGARPRARGLEIVRARREPEQGDDRERRSRAARPFAWWREGQFIRYTTTIALPRSLAQGRYTIWVGLFHGADRAPVHAPHARVDKDQLEAATFDIGTVGSGSGSGAPAP